MKLANLFCNGGGVSAQVEARGFEAVRWGGRFGARYDVCQAHQRRELIRLIRDGYVFGAFLTPEWEAGRVDPQSVRATAEIIEALQAKGVPWI